MGFLAMLNRLLGGSGKLDESERERLLQAWGQLDDSPAVAQQAGPTSNNNTTAPQPLNRPGFEYDRGLWRKKLGRILQELPDSQPLWRDLEADITPLGLDPQWVMNAFREEFTMLVRRVVSDGVITPLEHRNLDLARMLTGLSDEEAGKLVRQVVEEAEAIFQRPITEQQ